MAFTFGSTPVGSIQKKPTTPKNTTPAKTSNNTSGPGTSFSFGTYDDNTKKLQGGLFDPDGFDYGAALGGEPGKFVVTPNVPASM